MRPPPLRILLAFTPVLFVPACIPVVTHAPRVDPGLTVGTVASVATRPVLEGEVRTGQSTVTPVLAPSSVFARVGWTPRSSGVPLPVSLGVSVPIALPFSAMHPEADAYVQLSPAAHPELAAGTGVLLARAYTTPYAQVGRDLEDDVSLYTTQSVAFFHGGSRAPDATLWMPAAAVKFSEYSVFVQAGLGRERLGSDSTRAVRFLMIGGTVELRDRAIPRF